MDVSFRANAWMHDKTRKKPDVPLTHPYICTKCGTMGKSISENDLDGKPFPKKYLDFCEACNRNTQFICAWQYHLEYFPVRFVSVGIGAGGVPEYHD